MFPRAPFEVVRFVRTTKTSTSFIQRSRSLASSRTSSDATEITWLRRGTSELSSRPCRTSCHGSTIHTFAKYSDVTLHASWRPIPARHNGRWRAERIEIHACGAGFDLIDGDGVRDSSHLTLADAKRRAAFKFAVHPDKWRRIDE